MMRKLVLLLLVLPVVAAHGVFAQDTADGKKPKGDRQEFLIANFKTESGVTLAHARVVYGTYGKLNEAKDNVVLLPSHYMADFHGYEWLIRTEQASDRVLDPSK